MDPARIVTKVAIAVDHPAFAGHVPGRPMLPGVALVAEAMEAAAAVPALAKAIGSAPRLTVVKFLAPVAPGAALAVDVRLEARDVAFRIEAGGGLVAAGKFARADLAPRELG